MRFATLFNAQRHLIRDANPVAFQSHNFLRMVGKYANIFQPQINQNLRANAALVLHHALSCRLAIQLPARMKMNLRQHTRLLGDLNPKPTPGVMQIQKYAAVLFGNRFQRTRNQLRAIARDGPENIAR